MEDEFSLEDLVVDEEEVHTPAIMPVTVLVSETEYDEQQNLDDILNSLKSRLIEKYGFRRKEKKRYREGFLDFVILGSSIKCTYAREAPTRLDFEKGDLRITTKRLRAINPSFRVSVNFYIGKTAARIVLFGGDENISGIALETR